MLRKITPHSTKPDTLQRRTTNRMVLYPPPYDQLDADAIMQHVQSTKPLKEKYMHNVGASGNGVLSFVLRTYVFYWILMFLHIALLCVLLYRLWGIHAHKTQQCSPPQQRQQKKQTSKDSPCVVKEWTCLDLYSGRYRAVMCVFLAVLSFSTLIHVFTLDTDAQSDTVNASIYKVGCSLELIIDLILFGLSMYSVYSVVVQRRKHITQINKSLTVMEKVVEGMVYVNLMTAYNVIIIIMIIDGCINAAVWYGTVYLVRDMVIYGLVAFAIYCALHLAAVVCFATDLPFALVNYVSMIVIAADHEVYYMHVFHSKHHASYNRGIEACLMTVLCIGLVGIAISMLHGLYRLQSVADKHKEKKED